MAKLAAVTASDKQWPGTGLGADEVGYLLFDRNPDTYSDLNSGPGAYYVIDFGAGEDHTTRGDPAPATRQPPTASQRHCPAGIERRPDLDRPHQTVRQSRRLDLNDHTTSVENHYRYLRIYNATSWYGNLSEVELYGDTN